MRVRGRDGCVDDVKATVLNKNKNNRCLLFMKMFTSQNPLMIITQTLLASHPRLGDARSAPLLIFTCFLLHEKIRNQLILLLEA